MKIIKTLNKILC